MKQHSLVSRVNITVQIRPEDVDRVLDEVLQKYSI
jgi:hypothetical protein